MLLLLNRIKDFTVVGSFDSFEGFSLRLQDTPMAGLAAYLHLTGQRLAWVLPPASTSAGHVPWHPLEHYTARWRAARH
jgi:hypothetical protein